MLGKRLSAVIAAVALTVVAALTLFGGMFIRNNVTDQLTAQKIAFAPVGSDGLPQAIGAYGGSQVTNGSQAKVFADDYIESHVQSSIAAAAKTTPALVGVTTYSGVSAVSRANPKNAELVALVDNTFRGEMLRSSLLNAWGWWTFGSILVWFSVGMFVLAGAAVVAALLIGQPSSRRLLHRVGMESGHPSP